MLSISTTWNYKPDMNMRAWVSKIHDMGLNAIELDYNISREHLEEIRGLMKEMNLQVTSVHNFCPVPNDGPSERHISNYYRLSSLDKNERQKAVEWTKKTVDTAAGFGAQVVVIHAGTVESEDDRASAVFNLYKRGKRNTKEFLRERDGLLKQRQMLRDRHLNVLVKSLAQVVDYARKKKIRIGLENRYYPTEIPNFEEIGYLLGLFGGGGMGYWHDVGHAEMNERLGITAHLDYLNAYQDKLIGVHVHGMKGVRDHLAPFEGDLDLKKVLPFIKKKTLRVIETRHASYGKMKAAVKKLSSYVP
ncbi:MAG: hypothetical protein A2Y04_03355 [Omnitrophica WOR_2 bacterium GWC2_45_7]|nr:MAG: hypothetical protein A2Y04_03355 [Omnitrophica WOR_2 bacterium GWC2_45_7]